jgi:hypothetical protein
LHGTAYYIFLNSLTRLEEFIKNPHVKIPPKSPSTNFLSLGKFKIQFLFEKNSSSEFSPLGPAGLPTPRPWPAGRPKPSNPPRPKPLSPLGLSAARPAHAFSVFYSRRFPLRFTPSRASFIPHLQPPELARAATDSRSPSAAPLRASGALRPLPPRLYFPSLNSPP